MAAVPAAAAIARWREQAPVLSPPCQALGRKPAALGLAPAELAVPLRPCASRAPAHPSRASQQPSPAAAMAVRHPIERRLIGSRLPARTRPFALNQKGS